MPSSPIRKLAPYAEAAKRNGIHVYHLNIGQPDIKTPECALDVLHNLDRSILEYSPSDGYLSLRTKMVSYYAEYGIYLSPDEIIITTGGSEAVLFAFMSCLDPGDEIIITDPFYANYMAFAISAGAVIKSVTTSIENGFRLPSIEAFEEQTNQIVTAITGILETAPAELISDGAKEGIFLSGGGSQLYGMARLLQEKTGVKVVPGDEPENVVAAGAGMAGEYIMLQDEEKRERSE